MAHTGPLAENKRPRHWTQANKQTSRTYSRSVEIRGCNLLMRYGEAGVTLGSFGTHHLVGATELALQQLSELIAHHLLAQRRDAVYKEMGIEVVTMLELMGDVMLSPMV